jgi:hypothetical protein
MIIMKKPERPRYHWWVFSMEVWTLKQATLLLHGLDPNQYRSLKPYARNLPAEYTPLQKTYLVLQQYPWEDYLADYYFPEKGIHPAAVIAVAIEKKLPLPKRLRKTVIERFHRENQAEKMGLEIPTVLAPYMAKFAPEKQKIVHHTRTLGFTARERKNLLRSLGIVIRLWLRDEKSSPRYWYAHRLNASQIAQTILEQAQQMGLPTSGLKSLDRKITEAMALLDTESDD